MKPFVFTSRNGIHILNLEMTLAQIGKAQTLLRDITAKGGSVIFVGTKRQAKSIVRHAAEDAGAFFITERWLGGLFTNFGTVSKVIERLRKLTEDRKTGRLDKYTKKERFKFDDEIEKLEKVVGGMRNLTKIPQAIFVVDVKTDKTAVREARKLGIPIIAMVDTNTDPEGIAIPIPANDDATKSIELITSLMAEAVKEGLRDREAAAVVVAPEPQPAPDAPADPATPPAEPPVADVIPPSLAKALTPEE